MVLGSGDHTSIWYCNKYYLEDRKVKVVIGKEAAVTQINWDKGMFGLVCSQVIVEKSYFCLDPPGLENGLA